MANAIYGPGPINQDPTSIVQDGFVARGTGTVTTVPAANVEAVALQNLSGEYVRVVFTFAMGTTTAGNLTKLLPPYSSFQEEFSGAVIGQITTESVTLPPANPTGTAISTLGPSAGEHVVAIAFVEN